MHRLSIVLSVCLFGCSSETTRPEVTGLEGLRLDAIEPGLAVPGTLLVVEGASFLDVDLATSWLYLRGAVDGQPTEIALPATFVDFERLHVEWAPEAMAAVGPAGGRFEGTAQLLVDYRVDESRHNSNAIPFGLELRPALTPRLDDWQPEGAIFVNDPIPVSGDGFLLGGAEGTTFAVVEGCFRPTDVDACDPIAPVEVPLVPTVPFSRTEAAFAFSPRIAGIQPGRFEGTVTLRNDHQGGQQAGEQRSEAVAVRYDLLESYVGAIGAGGSVGQYIDVDGAGFVAENEGLTTLLFSGEYTPDKTATALPVQNLEVVPQYVSGRLVRYVIDEADALGQALSGLGGVRYASGTFEGTVQPIVAFEDQLVEGAPTALSFRIEPVKQVVWINFTTTYVESLRTFGLRALDQRIRDRILEVLRRDYEGVNVEFRTEPPEDYQIYAVVDVTGSDPNGTGLLGYDNTPGKDINNERLFDRIGGVNAKTQEDGFPGFGGVFVESFFTFSDHPPAGVKSEAPAELFDLVFDPLRPDRDGEPVTSADFADGDVPVLTSGDACPGSDRATQIGCAVWVLGSIIGSTVSHELGHSLGLSPPFGTDFHSAGDGPNRLMDAGGARPFEERAELMGQGPSRFCQQDYDYLRGVLPTMEPPPAVERSRC